ncbi:MAG: DUF3105 domain-containing protein [Candidatus Doudnabacteria bacterium]|nr:DUF3105 domain-containing protein [Candidatus Doudnabacteria bacterium]
MVEPDLNKIGKSSATDHASRRAEEEKKRRRAIFLKKLKVTSTWLAIPAIILALGFWWYQAQQKKLANLPGQKFTIQGQTHIPPSASHDPYNSNPPTSGSHYAVPADWGVYREPLPDEQLVHNLEHGGIWISYKNPEDKEMVKQLEDLVGGYKTKVILTPRAQNDAPIALAAWGRLQKLDKFDAEVIRQFIKNLVNKGPEFVP